MLMPKRVKRRKQFRGSMAGKAMRGNTISQGEIGLVALEPCCLDLIRSDPARLSSNKTEITIVDSIASQGFYSHGATELFTTFYSFWH